MKRVVSGETAELLIRNAITCVSVCSSSNLLETCPGNLTLSPLQALNPYSKEWALKAKVSQKFSKKSCMGKDGLQYSRFLVYVVDEHV